ncbi:hypothetical protein BRE01_60190 [Brevibacillus reuszeri]|uniref:Uncharacterized protein n=1 Tax=Brevibacillus reuszeri TaxID=54915 RepID=A0ABQ0TWW1_9BACL|nr:hypothetical protein [Brevibacillus reuszeri]MED1859188.1 hypothetical protein [Brevibacillus reuszeri]GED72317.1 hypothetical protein BRE01_60190 [Brevibacillus reuszeri]
MLIRLILFVALPLLFAYGAYNDWMNAQSRGAKIVSLIFTMICVLFAGFVVWLMVEQ